MTGLLNRQILDSIPGSPDESITREAFCVILARAVQSHDSGMSSSSVAADGSVIFEDWNEISEASRRYIMFLHEQELLQGSLIDGKIYMLPGSPITRQDAAVFLDRWLGITATLYIDVPFTDDGDIADYARANVIRLFNLGIVRGYPDGSFRPLDNVSFAEASGLIYRVLALPVAPAGAELLTYFGTGIIGRSDGAASYARFAMPHGVSIDNNGNLIIFDTFNASVRRIVGNRSETILGFTDFPDEYGFAQAFYLDGSREAALFGRPAAGVYASNGDLFIVDSVNNAIRLLRGDTVYTFAGGTQGSADGGRDTAQFYHPTAIAIDEDGNLFVTDTFNHTIRKITPDGAVSTVAGRPGQDGFRDGAVSQALFTEPSGITLGEDGVIYVTDTGNHVIRKIEDGTVTTIAGVVSAVEPGEYYRLGGYQDGLARSARFNFPRGIFYNEGTLFIADTGNHAVRALSAGNVVTLAGSGEPGRADGHLSIGMLHNPTSVVYLDGILYIADTLNNKIRIISVE